MITMQYFSWISNREHKESNYRSLLCQGSLSPWRSLTAVCLSVCSRKTPASWSLGSSASSRSWLWRLSLWCTPTYSETTLTGYVCYYRHFQNYVHPQINSFTVTPVPGTTMGSKISGENEHEIWKDISKNEKIGFNFVFRKYGLID